MTNSTQEARLWHTSVEVFRDAKDTELPTRGDRLTELAHTMEACLGEYLDDAEYMDDMGEIEGPVVGKDLWMKLASSALKFAYYCAWAGKSSAEKHPPKVFAGPACDRCEAESQLESHGVPHNRMSFGEVGYHDADDCRRCDAMGQLEDDGIFHTDGCPVDLALQGEVVETAMKRYGGTSREKVDRAILYDTWLTFRTGMILPFQYEPTSRWRK